VAFRNGASLRQREHAGETWKANNAFGKCGSPSSRTSNRNPAHFSVTDGRVACGTVDLINGAFVATDTSGAVVGRFPTLHQAMRAFEGGAS